jgi:hypothetical protein
MNESGLDGTECVPKPAATCKHGATLLLFRRSRKQFGHGRVGWLQCGACTAEAGKLKRRVV